MYRTTAESRAAGSAPALWFQAMTGEAFNPPAPHSYELAKNRLRPGCSMASTLSVY